MSAYAVLMQYRFMNFCIKAEPAALLTITINDPEGQVNIEDVASVGLAREDQFEIYPDDQKKLFLISKGIKESHPDFKVEQKELETSDSDSEEEYSILVTMPPVDDDRYKLMKDSVKVLYDEGKAKIEKAYVDYKARLAQLLLGHPKEEIDEATDEQEKIYKMHKETVDKYYEIKIDEIEKGHQRYLEQQTSMKEQKAEEDAARGKDAGLKMDLKMGDE